MLSFSCQWLSVCKCVCVSCLDSNEEGVEGSFTDRQKAASRVILHRLRLAKQREGNQLRATCLIMNDVDEEKKKKRIEIQHKESEGESREE